MNKRMRDLTVDLTMISQLAVKVSPRLMDDEINRFKLCETFWKTRKVTGLFSFFHAAHNEQCELRAQAYRELISALETRRAFGGSCYVIRTK